MAKYRVTAHRAFTELQRCKLLFRKLLTSPTDHAVHRLHTNQSFGLADLIILGLRLDQARISTVETQSLGGVRSAYSHPYIFHFNDSEFGTATCTVNRHDSCGSECTQVEKMRRFMQEGKWGAVVHTASYMWS